MKEETKHILEIITNIQEQMATKDDLKGIATKDDLKGMATKDDIHMLDDKLERVRQDLQSQISENTQAIDNLSEQIENVMGYAKEIDHVLSRVSTLEKQILKK